MEQKSKIIENYHQRLQEEYSKRAIQLTKEELITLIQEIVKAELGKLAAAPTEPKEPEPEFIGIKEASKFLNLAIATIYEKTCRGLIPFHKGEKKLYFKKSELQEWLTKKKDSTHLELKKAA